MISDAHLTKQLRRLLRLPFAPSEPEDQKAYIDEWKRVLRPRLLTEAHCTAVVDRLMESSSRIPSVAEVIEAAEQVPAPDAQKAPLGCEECNGIGFVIVERGDTSAADFCRCGLGEFKRASEARRRAEAAKAAK